MRARRLWAPMVCGAITADALVGAVRPGLAGVPFVTLSVVTAVALAAGPRVGMIAGFSAGAVLDLLGGPVSLAGVHTIVGVAVGVVTGSAGAHLDGRNRGATMIGALAVTAGAILLLALHGTVAALKASIVGLVPCIALAGALVTPLALRVVKGTAGGPLTNRAPRA